MGGGRGGVAGQAKSEKNNFEFRATILGTKVEPVGNLLLIQIILTLHLNLSSLSDIPTR